MPGESPTPSEWAKHCLAKSDLESGTPLIPSVETGYCLGFPFLIPESILFCIKDMEESR